MWHDDVDDCVRADVDVNAYVGVCRNDVDEDAAAGDDDDCVVVCVGWVH